MRLKKWRIWLSSALVAGLALTAPAGHAADTSHFAGHYSFAWQGIPIGALNLDASEQGGRYSITSTTSSSGLARFFAKHKTTNITQGVVTEQGYAPTVFASSYTLRGKSKSIHVDYAEGRPLNIVLTPPDRPGERPAIAPELMQDAVDPLTLFFAARKSLKQELANNGPAFTLKVHDGRRLSQLDFTIKGKESLRLGNKNEPVIHVVMKRTPLGGFQAKELKDAAEESPIHFYFADRADLVPVQLVMPIHFGSLKGTLQKLCDPGDRCL